MSSWQLNFGYKVGLRLCELPPVFRGNHEVGFTQPRLHILAPSLYMFIILHSPKLLSNPGELPTMTVTAQKCSEQSLTSDLPNVEASRTPIRYKSISVDVNSGFGFCLPKGTMDRYLMGVRDASRLNK